MAVQRLPPSELMPDLIEPFRVLARLLDRTDNVVLVQMRECLFGKAALVLFLDAKEIGDRGICHEVFGTRIHYD